MKASSKDGLSLMERSVEVFPIALAYRNLAVYWNSEGNAAKTDYYVGKALELDPNDAYNVVFAAVFMAANGHGDEALKIAREHEDMLPASYNLAAIYAQLGQRDKALAMLKRHFFGYERYQALRSKEMMEARVDAVFASLMKDPTFIALTSGADGRLPLPQDRGMAWAAAQSSRKTLESAPSKLRLGGLFGERNMTRTIVHYSPEVYGFFFL